MSKTKILTLWSDGKLNEGEIRVLRSISDDVVAPFGGETQKDIQKLMEAFLERDDAVGLAAPQIGICKRIIAFRVKGLNEKTRIKNPDDYELLINPRITQLRGTEEVMAEGCLSCPDINIEVSRPTEIKVRAMDSKGNKINKRYDGFVARIIQHEIDHLDGKLIVDYEGAIIVPETNALFSSRYLREVPPKYLNNRT